MQYYLFYLQMVQKPAWSCDNDVYAITKFLYFNWSITAPHYQAVGVDMMSHQFFENTISLHGKFSSRWKYEDTGS